MPPIQKKSRFKFFNRAQFARKTPLRKFELVARAPLPLPPHPAVWDWRNGIDLPILGNDTVGDCFYAAACHLVQVWTGQHGLATAFDRDAVVARYKVISGGDNGLGDDQIFPEFKSGIVGPNGPHSIFDELTVDPNDLDLVDKAIYFGVGTFFTASLADAWIKDPQPGDLWDVAPPNLENGHAMVITGKTPEGYYNVQTWGFDKPIRLTPKALQGCNPEIVVCVAKDQFAANGYTPSGIYYTQAQTYWQSYGGITLPDLSYPPPPGPAPAPVPVVPPTPSPAPAPPAPTPAPSPVTTGQLTAHDLCVRVQSAMYSHAKLTLLDRDTATAVAATVIHQNWTNLTAPN